MNLNRMFTRSRHPLGAVDYPFIPVALAAIGTAVGASASTATLTGALVAGTVVAGGVGAYGAYSQGQAQKNMMNYQAQVAQQQARSTADVAEANISGEQNQAAMKARMLARNASEILGSQEASAGAQGIGGSVTAADVAKDTFTKQQMDQMTLQYNANVKAWNITNEANNNIWRLGVEGNMDKMAARNSATAGNINTGSSLLNTATQVGTESMLFRGSAPRYEGVIG